MATLILAGGVIYTLPYLRQTFHRGLLQALDLTNAELGNLNSLFGIVAMIVYFPGGWLADRVSARVLLTGSLFATGLAGLWYARFPSYGVMLGLHAFMGVSTILTFWAALIKATRAWGAGHEQGRAFGILDGGRGIVEATLAVMATALFAVFGSGAEGLSVAITMYAVAHLLAAVLVGVFAPDTQPAAFPKGARSRRLWRETLSMPVVWLHAGVIFFAYCAFWGTHDFNAFAVEGLGRSEVFGATLATFRTWLRPIAAVGAGVLADRLRSSTVIGASFLIAGAGFVALAVHPRDAMVLLWIDVAVIGLAVFALRGIYYALLEEARVPMHLTGTTVGFISVLGYTPDIFIPQLTGWLFDTHPGAEGHRYFYALLAAGAVAGFAFTLALRRRGRARAEETA
jgi:sugar phosphate permease